MKSKLSAQERLSLIKRNLAGEPVIKLCKEAKVSRVLYYRWLNRYKKFGERGLKAKVHNIDPHIRRVSKEHEREVLNFCVEHPEYGIRRLLAVIPKLAGKPIVGHHGLQNILKRNNIYTYDLRFAYALSRRRFIPRFIFAGIINRVRSVWESFVPSLAPAPPPRFVSLLQGKLPIDLRTLFSFIGLTFVFLFGFVYWSSTFASPYANPVGLFFATIALFTGSIFFLYSLKYYFTIAIVLSYSQKDRALEGEVETGGGLFSWILGTSGKRLSKGGSNQGIGLTPDLSNITLERFPYISVQIPFYNEKNVVERSLKAAVSLDYKNYEVILCDDSTDETSKIISDYLGKFQPRSGLRIPNSKFQIQRGDGWILTSAEVKPGVTLKHLHRTTRSGFKGGALELARKLTSKKAEFITVFDADFVPYPDTLKLFLKYFKIQNNRSEVYTKSKVAAVQGYQWHVLNKSENWVTRGVRSEYAGSYVIERSGVEIYEGLKQIAGSVYMVRKDILDSVGWGTSITEDFELTLKLYERGFKVLYTPYIQGPAECVSTISRLIRQRMRWAEGHSFNVKKMFTRLLFGRWEVNNESKWVSSPLTTTEKLEFLYLSPYYLQAFFFLVGTFAWFMAEAVFPARLPFWTSLWGWSLVLTNLVALPLVNAVGLFLEESEEKDFFGILSFIALSYIVVPFQAYAAIKGFMETEEGPWFRTPKTGRITDIFSRAKFFRFLYGSLGGRPKKDVSFNFYLSLETANSKFDSFKIRPRYLRWVGNFSLALCISITVLLAGFAPFVPKAKQSPRGFGSIVNAKEAKIPNPPKNNEITEPEMVRYQLQESKALEYIFHPEPRVRIKLGEKEIEIELLDSPELGNISLERATKDGVAYTYKRVFDGIDLRYTVKGTNLQEDFILNKYSEFNSLDESVKLTGLVMAKVGNEIQIAPSDGGTQIAIFGKPFMYEEKNPEVKNYGITYEIEKETFGYKVKKALTDEGKHWLSDSGRSFPVVIDPPTLVQSSPVASAITEFETDHGSYQRKIVYSDNSSAWYAFNADLEAITYNKCLASSNCDQDGDWSAPVTVSTDALNQNQPSAWFQRAGTGDGMIFVSWIDDDATTQATVDSLAFRTINTASADALGTQCNSADVGTFANNADRNTYIAAGNNGDVLVGYSNNSGTDAEMDIFEVPTGGCTFTSRETGSGLPTGSQNVAVVPFEVATNRIVIIYNDAGGNADLRESQFDISTSTWNFSDNDVDGANNQNVLTFSAVSDGTDIWVLRADSATAIDFFRCQNSGTSCTGDTAHSSWSQSDAVPFSSLANVTEVSLSYISTSPSNTLVATILMDTTNEQVYFATTDADTISWGCSTATECSLDFTAGDNGNLSSTYYVANDTEVGVIVREAAAYSFSTLPENLWILLFLIPMLPGVLRKLGSRKNAG